MKSKSNNQFIIIKYWMVNVFLGYNWMLTRFLMNLLMQPVQINVFLKEHTDQC